MQGMDEAIFNATNKNILKYFQFSHFIPAARLAFGTLFLSLTTGECGGVSGSSRSE